MSEHVATIDWSRGDQSFTDGVYSRGHDWRFDGGAVVRGSSAPPVPGSDPAGVDPEEALVAAVSACHMLFFLAYAAKAGLAVDRYTDAASGTLGRDDRGKVSITRVTLRPDIRWGGEAPSAEVLDDLHHRAHEACYLANSIRGEVVIEPV
ncbi:MAG: OsmC family protein [Brevundimonas sp.]|uniref:OsmC family protein n=1 Tax=Brevundimonas sp. TaxID=1871086 RepID=UPI00273460FB|nr:OsmC family protein [Brevundimonas sp.]MDP3378293.1 OsmC family protein [Brevundimonas sp.]